MAAQVEGPFNYTATGVLGDQRNSMLQNELHLRDKVGHIKSRGYQLPMQSFVYGLPNEKREYSAADALASWKLSHYSLNSDPALRGWTGNYLPKGGASKTKAASERDFMTMNKAAVADGLVTTEETNDYRATHDIRRSPWNRKELSGKMRSRRLPPTMVFGIPSRPSTPIYEVIEHKYQDQWMKERQNLLSNKRAEEVKRRVMSAPVAGRSNGIVYETRASLLRTYQNPVDPAPLWQLPRFTKSAKAQIQSFRTNVDKSASFNYLKTDRVGRQGDFGIGIYEKPKN
ncbi:cilia- and flagella-associated protein 77-like isoform X1 [Biomphalaria glabrata]|uniref:Cilia- and flagella-associated protein 77-like isoform X1 n=1 Tax=Biomphalaria glabrata TaxID=6526 RepID=A0A9U8DW18_BIOGL|nr:cilia- and flagella-associated protein 77-like isoform X1 [Biomphalaria glabrata]